MQLINNRHLTSVSTTTDSASVNYEEQYPAQEAKYVVGYDEKLHCVAVNLECMYTECRVKWLKLAIESSALGQST